MQKSEQRRILKCWLLDILCAKAHFYEQGASDRAYRCDFREEELSNESGTSFSFYTYRFVRLRVDDGDATALRAHSRPSV